MRYIFCACILILSILRANALEIEDQARFGPDVSDQTLSILSTADISFIAPLIESFIATNPGVAVDYTVVSSTEVMRGVLANDEAFDLAISSAMDLQTKLANDGMARVHQSDATRSLPGWAEWNDMVFAFTQEPAAMVVSRTAFEGLPLPRNRQELITTLRENAERFRGKIGTYDVRQSGLGYLFATQDARSSETYWRLTEVMGALNAKLYCCSSDMIDAVVNGELAVGYNVLASYAQGRPDRDLYAIILPEDFTTVMLRSALIPTGSANPELSGQFIDHILSESFEGGTLRGFDQNASGAPQTASALRPIELGPALLVYLDTFKNRNFIAEWESAILQ